MVRGTYVVYLICLSIRPSSCSYNNTFTLMTYSGVAEPSRIRVCSTVTQVTPPSIPLVIKMTGTVRGTLLNSVFIDPEILVFLNTTCYVPGTAQ